MKKAKKLIMALVILVAMVAPAIAAESMTVTWKWGHDDANVNYYRYQVNNDLDDGWTVVSNTVLSYEATGLDPYQSYTLYLQCSYDGENWSESAVAVAEPLLAKEPVAPAAEVASSATVEEAVAPVQEEAAVAEEAQAAEEAAVAVDNSEKKAKSDYGFKANLLITGGASTNVTYDSFNLDGAFPRVGLALDLQNIVHAGHWGLGLRFDVDAVFEPEKQSWDNFDINDITVWYDSSADAKLMMYLGGKSFDLYLGGGAGYSIFNPHFDGTDNQELYGHSLGNLGCFSTAWFVSGNAGMRVRFNNVFSLGAEVNYRYLLPAEKHTASADLVLGFTF